MSHASKLAVALMTLTAPISGHASTIDADRVIEYFEPFLPEASRPNLGAQPANVFDGLPNGQDGGAEYEPVDLKIGTTTTDTPVTDGDATTYLSLPEEAFVTLGFSSGFIFDGSGDDLFIDEIGAASEKANVFVSEDFGSSFTFLDEADGGRLNSFDFADYAGLMSALGPDIKVNAVKLVGLDNLGTSPGFDLTFVRGLEGSVVEEPQVPAPTNPIPAPPALALVLSGFGAFALVRRRRA